MREKTTSNICYGLYFPRPAQARGSAKYGQVNFRPFSGFFSVFFRNPNSYLEVQRKYVELLNIQSDKRIAKWFLKHGSSPTEDFGHSNRESGRILNQYVVPRGLEHDFESFSTEIETLES